MMLQILEHTLLAPYTTLKVGGPARYFVSVEDEAQLVEVWRFANERGLPIYVLGEGSNVLVVDEGVQGVVVHMTTKGVHYDVRDTEVLLTAQAGEIFDEVIAHSVAMGWWGIENLSHIPGTVGASPIQNIGAYGVEIKDTLVSVRVFDTSTGTFETLTALDCHFQYRSSIFKRSEGKKFIVTAVTFALTNVPSPKLSYRDLSVYFDGKETQTLAEIRTAVIAIRAQKFPAWREVGTAGSFFKNPIISKKQFETLKEKYADVPGYSMGEDKVKISLGWILDKILNLRGYKKGNVATYEHQALVLVAHKGATSKEIEAFAYEVIEKIKNETDIDVEWEVNMMM